MQYVLNGQILSCFTIEILLFEEVDLYWKLFKIFLLYLQIS